MTKSYIDVNGVQEQNNLSLAIALAGPHSAIYIIHLFSRMEGLVCQSSTGH